MVYFQMELIMPSAELTARFGPGRAWVARAPGRVNIIGDHTDYNGGFVLPAAVDREVRIAFRPASDRTVELFSLDFNEKASFSLDKLDKSAVPSWAKYPMGVAWALMEDGRKITGLRGVVRGTVPLGAGLSSSAAIEAASVMAFTHAAGLHLAREKLALICQHAENGFVGMNCGIMDQYASLLGRKSCALFLDCQTLRHETVPLDEKLARIVVCDTKVKRELVNSAYNARRGECDQALAILRKHLPQVASYHDLTMPMFKAYSHDLPEPLLRRARHVVTENGRVLQVVKELQRGDLIGVGALMDASHESLRKDFEVSCRELDLLVDLAHEIHGSFGSRMTGAGFGGCTVNLVRPDVVDEFVRRITETYRAQTGQAPGVYVFTPSDGASVEEVPA